MKPNNFKWFEGTWPERLAQLAIYAMITFLMGSAFHFFGLLK